MLYFFKYPALQQAMKLPKKAPSHVKTYSAKVIEVCPSFCDTSLTEERSVTPVLLNLVLPPVQNQVYICSELMLVKVTFVNINFNTNLLTAHCPECGWMCTFDF